VFRLTYGTISSQHRITGILASGRSCSSGTQETQAHPHHGYPPGSSAQPDIVSYFLYDLLHINRVESIG
jgi:hypothetical protein